jgi:kynureninase
MRSMAADGARSVFDDFAALPAEPPDVAPWLTRLAASTGATDPFGQQSAEAARAFALALDAANPLSSVRGQFHIPKAGNDATRDAVYLTGHSLGLQPVSTAAAVQAELDKWAAKGVAGHFEGDLPWASCEEKLVDLLGELVGARNPQLEVAGMNSLTVNLHFLMAAFYRPVAGRAGILIEAGAFPSDRYAVASQITHHGFDPAEWMVEVQPDPATGLLTTDAITDAIACHEDQLAMILLGGVNYLTGQVRHREGGGGRVP